jgi:hypothetical protein
MCAVWGYTVVLKDHTSRQMSSYLTANRLMQSSNFVAVASASIVVLRDMRSHWMSPFESLNIEAASFPANWHPSNYLILVVVECFHCILACSFWEVKWSTRLITRHWGFLELLSFSLKLLNIWKNYFDTSTSVLYRQTSWYPACTLLAATEFFVGNVVYNSYEQLQLSR